MTKDEFYMKKAISLARKGIGKTSPNPLVGCVVVKNDKIIGSGYHEFFGGPHAEVKALENLKPKDCKGASLYITLEPCNHFGKTPPCTELISKYPFKRIVISTKDSNPSVKGHGLRQLKKLGFNVVTGVEEKAVKELNEPYFKFIKENRPLVTLKAAISIDGKIATLSGNSKWITCKNSRKDAHRLRYLNDAVMVGINTVIMDNPKLDCRLYKKDKKPARIVIDPRGRTPLKSYISSTANEIKTFIVVSDKLAKTKKIDLQKTGALTIELADKNGLFNLGQLMIELGKRDIASVLIEGGSKLLGHALEQKIADKLYMYIAPVVLGSNGLSVFSTNGINNVTEGINFKNTKIKKIGRDVRLTGVLRS